MTRAGARTAVLAHRGNSGEAPENTLAAFRPVAATGADGVEFDVQASADGVPVVIHDLTLRRTAGDARRLADLTLAELQALDAGSWFGPAFRGERIPTLAQVLELFRPTNLVLHIELKTLEGPFQALVERVAAQVRERGLVARTVFSSFNHHTLLEVARYLPEVPRAALLSDDLIEPWAYARAHGFAALHVGSWLCREELVRGSHAAGLPVRVYTVDDPAEARRLMAMGVDGLFTNHPRRLVALR
ncbi:MAG: glycerophosphodiester phosphodiesterase [Candidatus Lambdaproteobacteria bacterium]|nr:glycerophosphodiester phosphodiesterase [Candidatus Lambdaproteobacteria bacterium]